MVNLIPWLYRGQRCLSMTLSPLDVGQDIRPAFHLRYTWTAWCRERQFSSRLDQELIESISPLWEQDGIRQLESEVTAKQVQIIFSTKPHVSPVLLASRAKGRLQYALRQCGETTSPFRRNYAIRSVGENRTADIETYLKNQVEKERFIDPRFTETMQAFTVRNHEIDLAEPTTSAKAHYWYNLHLVLVTAERYRVVDEERLMTIRDTCFRIAAKKGYKLPIASVMPDHIHLALRGVPDASPEEIALAFQNNLAYALGQIAIWKETYYAGTFGEYDMGAVRAALS
jgi:REP element-mobilizing transposase RayT